MKQLKDLLWLVILAFTLTATSSARAQVALDEPFSVPDSGATLALLSVGLAGIAGVAWLGKRKN